mmetsp:Transcript_14119/g.53056  ORF Transcript_14119/g.53056 Transcript_14119/m.53056 type:complete len:226 (+) Transcript_14119:295-972(+)
MLVLHVGRHPHLHAGLGIGHRSDEGELHVRHKLGAIRNLRRVDRDVDDQRVRIVEDDTVDLVDAALGHEGAARNGVEHLPLQHAGIVVVPCGGSRILQPKLLVEGAHQRRELPEVRIPVRRGIRTRSEEGQAKAGQAHGDVLLQAGDGQRRRQLLARLLAQPHGAHGLGALAQELGVGHAQPQGDPHVAILHPQGPTAVGGGHRHGKPLCLHGQGQRAQPRKGRP